MKIPDGTSLMRTLALSVPVVLATICPAATRLTHYYAHDAMEDRYGVIAPWYKGQNGQYDLRVRIAAETIKRYPWVTKDGAVSAAPEYVYNGSWSIDAAGNIAVVPETDWDYGDTGQRGAYIISSLIDYYRYSGDAAAFRIITATADYLISHCETQQTHAWPGILISVPTKGVRYRDCRLGSSDDLKASDGKIQLDIVGEVGWQLVRAYEMTGQVQWFNAAKHWADLMAKNRGQDVKASPWGRYVDNEKRGMNGVQTGGVVYVLMFLDELIRAGHLETGSEIVEARNAAREYLKTVLLPAWTTDDTWGRNYWDWEEPEQAENISHYLADYLMDHKDVFPNWKIDVRNILSLFLNHTAANPASGSDTFSGAWAFPEGSTCCLRSLWYAPMELATVLARYGAEANSEWGRELARRSQLLATYDVLPNGQSQDLIDGGAYVSKTWFKIAHPVALKHVLSTMSWSPEIMGANRENHILRSSSVIKKVVYGKDRITYSTFDAPAENIDVLRLAFLPNSVTANGNNLPLHADLTGNGYFIHNLNDGDFIVTIRHDGATEVVV